MIRAKQGESQPRAQLLALFRAALAAVDPAPPLSGIAATLATPPGRFFAVAAGKAALPMAAALEAVLGPRIAGGLAVTKDGHGAEQGAAVPARFALRCAGHPLPDARSAAAGRAALELARRAGPGDALIVLLSGGASALLACPAAGLGVAELRAATDLLLRAGTPIGELNTVRKRLDCVAGGRLALAAANAGAVHVLVLPDVPGGDIATIASGPCAPDATTWREARNVLERRGVWPRLSARLRAEFEAGLRGARGETPQPGAAVFARVRHHLLPGNPQALAAAARAGRARGFSVQIADAALCGEARHAGRRLAGQALAAARTRRDAPLLLLAGGETTVTVRGGGRGGRNQELALAAALALDGARGIALLAAGSDGGDGPTDAAGAFADGGSVARGRAAGCDAAKALARNDSHGFFSAEGGLLRTGPTGTNVMDLVLILVE